MQKDIFVVVLGFKCSYLLSNESAVTTEAHELQNVILQVLCPYLTVRLVCSALCDPL